MPTVSDSWVADVYERAAALLATREWTRHEPYCDCFKSDHSCLLNAFVESQGNGIRDEQAMKVYVTFWRYFGQLPEAWAQASDREQAIAALQELARHLRTCPDNQHRRCRKVPSAVTA